MTVLLTERHLIRPSDPRWVSIDHACWLSKNLWNYANYLRRQAFIFHHHILSYSKLAHDLIPQSDFCALPRKVSQWVLKQLDDAWSSFFKAKQAYEQHPELFTGEPRLPHYKAKETGRNLLVYTRQALSQPALRRGFIQPSGLDIAIRTQQKVDSIKQVRIIPHLDHYTVEVVYSVEAPKAKADSNGVASIDIGLNNLAALTFNQPGAVPLLVNGRPLKAINQWYNKQRARLQSLLPMKQKSSHRLRRLTHRRNQRINAYLHLASRRILEELVKCGVATLIIGKNEGWKQAIELGKVTNQNFVQIPHARFVEMLTYKAQLAGITVIETEESYTSKCSFLDLEPVTKHKQYAGKRVHRGLFRASDGRQMNADVNGSYNILRKVIPNAFGNGIAGAVVHPVRLHLTKQTHR